MTHRCDVVLPSAGHEAVYINGTMVGSVIDVNLTQDGGTGTRVTIEFRPSSLIYGDVPNETVEALNEARDGAGTVDISRAISRARARVAGLDPVKHAKPSAGGSGPPAAVSGPTPKKRNPVQAAYDDVEKPVLACTVTDHCHRPDGHKGACA